MTTFCARPCSLTAKAKPRTILNTFRVGYHLCSSIHPSQSKGTSCLPCLYAIDSFNRGRSLLRSDRCGKDPTSIIPSPSAETRRNWFLSRWWRMARNAEAASAALTWVTITYKHSQTTYSVRRSRTTSYLKITITRMAGG